MADKDVENSGGQGSQRSELSLADVLRQALDAHMLDQMETACRKLMHHRDLDKADRMQFYNCWQEADILLGRKDQLAQELYELVLTVEYRYFRDAVVSQR